MGKKVSAEARVKEIRRQTRRQHTAEEKIRMVLDGLRGEETIAELCRREGIAQSLYYKWSKEFLEAGKLSMNGASVAIARWKRNLELWIRKLLPIGPFIGLFIGGYSIVAAPPLLTYPLSWLWIVIFGLIAVFMEPMWAIFTRNWLPHDYLRFLLESRGALSHLTRRLTLRLLS